MDVVAKEGIVIKVQLYEHVITITMTKLNKLSNVISVTQYIVNNYFPINCNDNYPNPGHGFFNFLFYYY